MRSLFRTALTVILLVLLACTVQAQAVTLEWDNIDASATPAVAATWTYTVYVNAAPGVVLTGVTCGAPVSGISVPGAVSTCRTSTPPAGVQVGADITLTAKTPTSGEGPRSVPFVRPPSAPMGVRSR